MTGTGNSPSFNNGNSKPKFAHTWEPSVAQRISIDLASRKEGDCRPYMVSLVGIPGGGKSVSSEILAELLENQGVSSIIMPHDGYHYPIEQLKLFPDARDMIYRRGAPDTFDPKALMRDLGRIRDGHEEAMILVPGFDHGKGDPESDAHAFERAKHKVVIVEGLYLLHDQDGWADVANYFDLKIFIESDVETCVKRLKIRNTCIPGYSPEEIEIRCEKVDRINAMTVMKTKHRADMVVHAFVPPTAVPIQPKMEFPIKERMGTNHILVG